MRASHRVDSPRLAIDACLGRGPPGQGDEAASSRSVIDDASARRFEAMVNANFQPVWRALFHLGVASADLDDAVQQVFCAALGKVTSIREVTERAWLMGVALRVAFRFRRTYARRREVSDDALVNRSDSGPAPDDLVDRQVLLVLIQRVLDAMPDDLREVFVLYEIEDMTVPEIAGLLAVPTGTVASRLRRARAEFERRVKLAQRPGRAR